MSIGGSRCGVWFPVLLVSNVKSSVNSSEVGTVAYNASSIKIQEGLNAVREFPGMYIGETNKVGLHHMLWEVVDNSIDEAMVPASLGGCCDEISVTVNADGSITVKDNGRGIPVDIHEQVGVPTVEVVLTQLHAGGKSAAGTGYSNSGGLHGVGISVVNALSSWVDVVVERDGSRWGIGFAYDKVTRKTHSGKSETVNVPGNVVRPLEKLGNTRGKKVSGTSITFMPDPKVFTTVKWDYDVIRERLEESSYLNRGVRIIVEDKRPGQERRDVFHSENGVIDFVNDRVDEYVREHSGDTPETTVERVLPLPIHCTGEMDGQGAFNMALQWVDTRESDLLSFSNSVKTRDGGVHLEGCLQGLKRALSRFATQSDMLPKGVSNLDLSDIRSGLHLVLSASVDKPQYDSQTKDRLTTDGYKSAISSAAYHSVWSWVEENPAEALLIVEKAVHEMLIRKKLDAAEMQERVKSNGTKPKIEYTTSLIDCLSNDSDVNELFIAEGKSAANPATEARDAEHQAILPIRGKILNTVEVRGKTKKVTVKGKKKQEEIPWEETNAEFMSIVSAIGAGTKDYCDPSKSNFNKIIILTDADDDGRHIEILLIGLFFEHMYPLIEAGMLYVVKTPLWCVKTKGERLFWHYPEAKFKEEFAKIKAKDPHATSTRFKGLGEMNPDELGETALIPGPGRHIYRITPDDREEVARTVEVVLSSRESKKKLDMVMSLNMNAEEVAE